ncbi:MAG TPA: 1-(5-phosphoribosyl)-5-[(5-phosphoribosylamino)methylideneamino]imidazole-4-carboxamide isomerase [Syntrophomonas sp.]|jgi:phosphoribosylformimino-5-aminoimidazole carboxamide ribotide isomerase|nr:1-(5-phosphoribosyl)-5-[(5-phosphoribosylamino)methylideneamino]imidazole-4-carboxamide isomerase [Syntrophomonas sp.]
MIILPAIDLKDGQCVRLVQGALENKTVYSDTPAQVAASFQAKGAEYLHIVDLDGAFAGRPANLDAIRAIAAEVKIPFEVGGGLRSIRDVDRMLELGASRVIIGTNALNEFFLSQMLEEFGPDKIIVGLDVKDGMVAVKGWVEKSEVSAIDLACQVKELGIKTAVFTDISRDGLLQGPNLSSVEEIAKASGLKIIASGGVATVENIQALKALESAGVCGAVIGKALYDGKITLEDALAAAK